MGSEIERKFLIDLSLLPDLGHGILVQQTYLSSDPWVRVRLTGSPGILSQGLLTIKGQGTVKRPEFNYAIPSNDALELLDTVDKRITKIRRRAHVGRHAWDVDQFLDQLEGLWLAEVELGSVDEVFEKPPWTTVEVTEDIRYSNAYLLEHCLPRTC